MKVLTLALALVIAFTSNVACAASKPELHKLRVHGQASYRCYAGYNGKKVNDERTGEACDNKTSSKVLIDKVVAITITDEPDPENSPELAGHWQEDVALKGRKFSALVTIFKAKGAAPYTVTVTAHDDEPVARTTRTSTSMRTLREMNPVAVSYTSAGKKEEISFDLKVEPAK
jgi:hypothetical protein